MLGAKLRRDPDNCAGARARRIKKDLPEMGMISGLELVFDDQDCVVGQIAADEIEREVSDGLFCPLELEINFQDLRQVVAILEQPRRKVEPLMRPDRAYVTD